MVRMAIRTGGQTGVDRAALDFAMWQGLPYWGWCPRGGWAEDHPNPPGVLALYPRLTETPTTEPEQRTSWNVRDSHATMVLIRGDDMSRSPGTVFTRRCAELIFLRPFVLVDLSLPGTLAPTREWLSRVVTGLGVQEFVLNIGGPRESQAPGIYTQASRFLAELLR